MLNIFSIIAAFLPVAENLIPIFVHSPAAQGKAAGVIAVIATVESEIANVIAAINAAKNQTAVNPTPGK